ncbi:hypothetical protein ABIB48_003042 [Arthrobacter sp. UYCu511]|uniref:hypothetical protein n=1 Tax=Arthrobacter sp. UYCu511 TaxID=3156337 RepID=UPI003395F15D
MTGDTLKGHLEQNGLVVLSSLGVNAVHTDAKSLMLDGTPVRLVRIAFGVALFAALFFFLGSSGAFAAPDAPASSDQSPAKGKGLISGILSPVVNVVDKSVSQVPVVKDIVGNNTVSKVVAPVSGITDRAEQTASSIPVVEKVIAPVRNVTTSVVPPVVNVVDSITAPVLGTVDHVTAPVVQVLAPVVAPVTGTLKPVVDGVTGTVVPVGDGVKDVIDQVLPPVKPGTPGTPGAPGSVVPGTPITPATPGADLEQSGTSATPGNATSAADGTEKSLGAKAPLGAQLLGTERSGLKLSVSGGLGSLAQYLASGAVPGSSGAVNPAAMAVPSLPVGSSAYFSCDSDTSGLAVGPCAPAVSSSPASATGSGSGASGAGGPSGSGAAQENFAGHFSIAVQGSTLRDVSWSLPASMPSNPGSTPG